MVGGVQQGVKQMATTKRKPLDNQAGIELYILELAAEYKVGDRFLISVA